MDYSKFHVISVVSNPVLYQARYDLYKIYEEDIIRKGANLWTLEVATGARFCRITDAAHPQHTQVWSSGLSGTIWLKENMMNLAVQQLTLSCPDWRYVCFLDADIRLEAGWLEATAHQLQLHPVVQPWSHAVDKCPQGGAIGEKMQLSFAYCHVNQIEVVNGSTYTRGGHPGYGLAMRREAFNHLGGLIQTGVLGSGDRHMLTAIVGKVHESYHPNVTAGYKKVLHLWQDRAVKYLKKNLGYTPCVIRHEFHGSKKNRAYGSRWGLLTKWQFDPYTDLKTDSSGIQILEVENERQIGFRDDCYRYFRSRREDSKSL